MASASHSARPGLKLLERGQLRVKTDSMSTLKIEWLDVARVESKQFFRVESADGLISIKV